MCVCNIINKNYFEINEQNYTEYYKNTVPNSADIYSLINLYSINFDQQT